MASNFYELSIQLLQQNQNRLGNEMANAILAIESSENSMGGVQPEIEKSKPQEIAAQIQDLRKTENNGQILKPHAVKSTYSDTELAIETDNSGSRHLQSIGLIDSPESQIVKDFTGELQSINPATVDKNIEIIMPKSDSTKELISKEIQGETRISATNQPPYGRIATLSYERNELSEYSIAESIEKNYKNIVNALVKILNYTQEQNNISLAETLTDFSVDSNFKIALRKAFEEYSTIESFKALNIDFKYYFGLVWVFQQPESLTSLSNRGLFLINFKFLNGERLMPILKGKNDEEIAKYFLGLMTSKVLAKDKRGKSFLREILNEAIDIYESTEANPKEQPL